MTATTSRSTSRISPAAYKELKKRELLTEESNAYQYRWETIVDLDTNEPLFEIEHEIRSMTHPLYNRPLVNRNPMQSQQSYQLGGDEWDWQIRRTNVRLPDVPPPTGPSAAAYSQAPRHPHGRRRCRKLLPLPHRGEGWGEGRAQAGCRHPHPAVAVARPPSPAVRERG